MRILAVSGSLRRSSYNTRVLRAAADLVPAGVELELYEELELVPPYNEDRDTETPPAAAVRLREAIAGADALLIATPEYNSSVPGQLKNAVDWASRPFRESALWGKPTAVVSASRGAYGAMWAQAELRKVLARSGARVLDEELAVSQAHERFDGDGRLLDETLRRRLADVVEQLVELADPAAVAA